MLWILQLLLPLLMLSSLSPWYLLLLSSLLLILSFTINSVIIDITIYLGNTGKRPLKPIFWQLLWLLPINTRILPLETDWEIDRENSEKYLLNISFGKPLRIPRIWECVFLVPIWPRLLRGTEEEWKEMASVSLFRKGSGERRRRCWCVWGNGKKWIYWLLDFSFRLRIKDKKIPKNV